MQILAVDSSSLAASCALLRDGVLIGENFLNASLTHSQTLVPMIENLLTSAGVQAEDIDIFAVSTGPGSFTGLRIGIAAVKGMALSLGKPCAAVGTLPSLAQNAVFAGGIIVPAMDARRSQVYTAMFESSGQTLSRLMPDRAVSIQQLREDVLAFDGAVVTLVGDGAELCKSHMADMENVRVAPQQILHQRAGSVAVIAAGMSQSELCTAHELETEYLRLPQAERELMAKLERK